MYPKRLLFVFFSIMLNAFALFSQKVVSSSDKADYATGEKIVLTFKFDLKADSIGKIYLGDFIIMGAPSTHASTSIINGDTTGSMEVNYTIRSYIPGQYTIESLPFYVKGKKYQGKSIKLNITGKMPTEAELKKIRLEQFREMHTKPKGTVQYVLNNDCGYIEVFNGSDWEFQRALSPEEIKTLMKK